MAGTGCLSLLQVSLLVAFGLIVAKIVTLEEARRFMDANVLLLMATSFGLGLAVEQSGLASTIAHGVVSAAAPLGIYVLLAAVLAATMLVTEVISNMAAAALMFPIAIAIAEQADSNALPFAVIVIFGASLSFLTSIGYPTNTMVWAMGGIDIPTLHGGCTAYALRPDCDPASGAHFFRSSDSHKAAALDGREPIDSECEAAAHQLENLT